MFIEQVNITSFVDDRNITDNEYEVCSKFRFLSTLLRDSIIAASQRKLCFLLDISSDRSSAMFSNLRKVALTIRLGIM